MTPLQRDISSLPVDLRCLTATRQTKEMIRVDFVRPGGVHDSMPGREDTAMLTVSGPYEAMQPLIPIFKQLGLRYSPQGKHWGLGPVMGYQQRLWGQLVPKMVRAYEKLKPLIEAENAKAKQHNDSLVDRPQDPKEFAQYVLRMQRLNERVRSLGIDVKYDFRRGDEPRVYIGGRTYDILELMRKYKFKWLPSDKVWMMPEIEFRVIGDKWRADVIRKLEPQKSGPSTSVGVFSAMSDRELTAFLGPVVEADFERNEGYDGEVSVGQLMAQWKLRLKRMPPEKQQSFYDEWNAA